MHRLVSHARRQAVGYLALFVALGGTGYAAFKVPKNSVGSKQLKNGAVTTKKLAHGAVTGSKVNLATLGTVPSASNATNAGNANTVGGHMLGYAHVVWLGSAYQIDSSESTAGVTVSSGGFTGRSCLAVPFTPRSATGTVDVLSSSSDRDVLHLTPIKQKSFCSVGQIMIQTFDPMSNSPATDSYLVAFSS